MFQQKANVTIWFWTLISFALHCKELLSAFLSKLLLTPEVIQLYWGVEVGIFQAQVCHRCYECEIVQNTYMHYTLYCWKCMKKKKKILSITEKASGTSDVSSRREIALPINSSLLELTSKVPEPFSISLKTFFLCDSSNVVHSILYKKCSAIHIADSQTSCWLFENIRELLGMEVPKYRIALNFQ